MIRRLHTPKLFVGEIALDPGQTRHARDVLRLAEGTNIEMFDDQGVTAMGTLVFHGSRDAAVRVERIEQPQSEPGMRLTVASAVPKGERADWMVEKLGELGVFAFIPLAAERSVVKPEGKNKRERWVRIATESAKQSHRVGVMRIEELTSVKELLKPRVGAEDALTLYLSTLPDAVPLAQIISDARECKELLLFIGPEGGWTDAEIGAFENSGVRGVRLTRTVLRVETAAIAGAAVGMLLLA